MHIHFSLLAQGTIAYAQDGSPSVARWGDYSAILVDPNDGVSFATFQEDSRSATSGTDLYTTWYEAFQVVNSGAAAPADVPGDKARSWIDSPPKAQSGVFAPRFVDQQSRRAIVLVPLTTHNLI